MTINPQREQLLGHTLHRQRLAAIQDLVHAAAHPIVPPGVGDEPGLVRGILTTVREDEQPLLVVRFDARLGVLGRQAVQQALGQYADSGRRAQ